MTPGVILSMLYCGAAFGGSFLFMRVAAADLPAPAVAFLRVGIAALVLLLISGPRGLRALRADWRRFAFLGVFMTGGPFLLFAAAEHTITAGLGAVINATTPMTTVLIVFIWLRQPLTVARVVGIIVGFAGVAVIVGIDGLRIGPGAATGVALALLAASLYGIGLTFARRHMSAHQPIELAFGQLAAAAVLLAPLALLTSGEAHPTLSSAGAVLGIAIVSTAIAWPLVFRLVRQVGPVSASTITFLNPIFGVLWGALFLGEVITPTLLAGGLVVFLALALILDIRPKRMHRTTQAS